MERQVGALPVFLKEALLLNGMKKPKDYRLMREENFDIFIREISDQVSFFSSLFFNIQ